MSRKNVLRCMSEHCEAGFNAAKIRMVRGYRQYNKGQGRKISYPKEVDERILKWLLRMLEKHFALSTQMFREKAVVMSKQHHFAFKGSEGWLRMFMH